MLPQLLVLGLAVGCIYALVALGFTLIYRALRMVNFAQGQVFMLGAFIGLALAQTWGLNPLILLAVVSVLTFGLGMVAERVIYRRLRHNHESFVVGAIGFGVALENTVRLFFPEPVRFPRVFGVGVVDILGARVNINYVWIVAAAVVLVTALHLLLNHTRVGRALRAVASDADIASTIGVDVSQAINLTFGLSFAMGAIAGVLTGPLYFVSFDMGAMVGLKAFSAAVIGGINSIPGTICGGIALGIIEALFAGYISSEYRDLGAFVILIMMLFFRPQGFLGTVVPVKV